MEVGARATIHGIELSAWVWVRVERRKGKGRVWLAKEGGMDPDAETQRRRSQGVRSKRPKIAATFNKHLTGPCCTPYSTVRVRRQP